MPIEIDRKIDEAVDILRARSKSPPLPSKAQQRSPPLLPGAAAASSSRSPPIKSPPKSAAAPLPTIPAFRDRAATSAASSARREPAAMPEFRPPSGSLAKQAAAAAPPALPMGKRLDLSKLNSGASSVSQRRGSAGPLLRTRAGAR